MSAGESKMQLSACRCLPGAECVPMPNRFRKVLNACDWWGEKGESVTAQKAISDCTAAIGAEFGDDGLSACHCVSMEPVVIRMPA
jgi:hypothetical protein